MNFTLMTYLPLTNLHCGICMHLLQTGFMHNYKLIFKKTFKELHNYFCIFKYLRITLTSKLHN